MIQFDLSTNWRCHDDPQQGGLEPSSLVPGRSRYGLRRRLWNDVQFSFNEAGLRPLVTVLTIVLNSDHGPWQAARWLQTARESVSAYLGVADDECPLLQNFFHRIIAEMGLEAELDYPDLGNRVLESLPECVSHIVPKIVHCRWFGFTDFLLLPYSVMPYTPTEHCIPCAACTDIPLSYRLA